MLVPVQGSAIPERTHEYLNFWVGKCRAQYFRPGGCLLSRPVRRGRNGTGGMSRRGSRHHSVAIRICSVIFVIALIGARHLGQDTESKKLFSRLLRDMIGWRAFLFNSIGRRQFSIGGDIVPIAAVLRTARVDPNIIFRET